MAQLKAYKTMVEEAKKRDHRKLGERHASYRVAQNRRVRCGIGHFPPKMTNIIVKPMILGHSLSISLSCSNDYGGGARLHAGLF